MLRSSDGWQVRVAALTDVGPVRMHNEDSVAVLVPGEAELGMPDGQWTTGRVRQLATDAGVGLLVLDGLGGQSTGDVPCSRVLESLTASFTAGVPGEPEAQGPWLVDALRRASVYTRERGTPHAGQGATAALAVVHGAVMHIVHAGDVRAYLLRDGRLEQRTRDDSLRNDALDQGFDAEQLRDLPRGIITQALGYGDIEPHLQSFALAAGDVLLLCSDGLHEFVAAEALAATLQSRDDPAQVCAELVAMAVNAHSTDNISALVARIERGAPSGQ